MKPILAAIFLALTTVTLHAQAKQGLKKVMELKMPKTADDDMPGTRGACVAWHPVQKKYYAVFAGNEDYPMAVFDATGKRLSDDDETAMIDTRGLWYDPTQKKICGNAHGDFGWFTYKLNGKGLLSDIEMTEDGMNQPDEQSVGTYNAAAKAVLFIYRSQVYIYNSDADVQDSLQIHWGRKKTDGPGDDEDILNVPEDYNYTSLIYTGVKGQELGFLNITNKVIELYDLKTGFLSKTLSLPETSVPEGSFNFAYANGIYWLFNMELRKWVGYR